MTLSPNQITDLIKRQTPRTLMDGIVKRLDQNIAHVQLYGGTQPERAKVPAATPVRVGDHVLLFRPEYSIEWLIVSNFSRGQELGHGQAARLHTCIPTPSQRNVTVGAGSLVTIATLSATLTRGVGLVAATGHMRCTATSGELELRLFLRMDDRDLGMVGASAAVWCGAAFPKEQGVVMIAPFDNAAVGNHQFSIAVSPGMQTLPGCTFSLNSFFVMEI